MPRTEFNIHYHRGNDVVYPVKRNGVKSGAAGFVAKLGHEYCMMWTNPTRKAATLTYRFAVE